MLLFYLNFIINLFYLRVVSSFIRDWLISTCVRGRKVVDRKLTGGAINVKKDSRTKLERRRVTKALTHAINPFNFTSYVPQTSPLEITKVWLAIKKKNDGQRLRAAGTCVSHAAPFIIVSLLHDPWYRFHFIDYFQVKWERKWIILVWIS